MTRTLAAVLSLGALTGCDPTLQQYLPTQKALTDATVKTFPRVAGAVRVATPTDEPSCRPPVPLVTASGSGHNTEVITLGRVDRAGADYDPASAWSELPFELSGGAAIERVAQDVHPTMQQYRPPGLKMPSSARAQYEDAARVAYLVVLQTQSMDRSAGTATVNAFLVDWKKAEVLCGFATPLSVGKDLGTTAYQVVREKRDGTREVLRKDQHDNFENAMYAARARVNDRVKAAWGIDVIEP